MTGCRATFAMLLAASLFGCGSSVRVFEPPVDAGAGTDGSIVVDTATPPSDAPSPLDTATADAGKGKAGAPCRNDSECIGGVCLDNGRCSEPCEVDNCPKGWGCAPIPGKGKVCQCTILSMDEVACNGLDDNCDGRIDETAIVCAGACADPMNDPKNCGMCGVACGVGTVCKKGKCDCPSDKPNLCAAGCTDTKTDVANCGACGKPCPADNVCTGGVCSKPTIVPVDVLLLLDNTGSNAGPLSGAKDALKTRMVKPLLAMSGVNVGLAYTCEFPKSPYGSSGDYPFKGVSEPITVSATLESLIEATPALGGGDAADGMIEALGSLSGLAVHPLSFAMTCSTGRIAGGCWRPEARKVIVLFTDDIFHNGPDPAGGTALYEPYADITPAPHAWPGVLTAMKSSKTTLLIMNSNTMGSTAPGFAQWKVMLTALGQKESDIFPSSDSTATGTASDAIVARVTAIRSGL